MDNRQVTAEWIAKQRKLCDNAKQLSDGKPSNVTAPLWACCGIAMPAALDALEASMQREAEKDAEIKRFTHDYATSTKRLIDEKDRLTAERDAAVKIIRDARVYLDELGSPQYCLYQLMKWPCDENGGEEDGNKN